jgi:hypothetical protein
MPQDHAKGYKHNSGLQNAPGSCQRLQTQFGVTKCPRIMPKVTNALSITLFPARLFSEFHTLSLDSYFKVTNNPPHLSQKYPRVIPKIPYGHPKSYIKIFENLARPRFQFLVTALII